MQTRNTITIASDPDTVFRTVARALDWPAMLPHYCWVRQTGEFEGMPILDMVAYRSGVKLRCLSLMWQDPEARRIYFKHIGGPTRGMDVEWFIEPIDGGSVVSVVHDLGSIRAPIVRRAPGRLIAGHVFIKHVTGQTLRHMKRWLEEGCQELLSPA